MLQFQLPPTGVTPRDGVGPQVWYLGEGLGPQVWCLGRGVGPQVWCVGRAGVVGGTLPWDLSHDVFDVTYPLWTDRRLRKHYLPQTSFAGGNKTKVTYISDHAKLALDFWHVHIILKILKRQKYIHKWRVKIFTKCYDFSHKLMVKHTHIGQHSGMYKLSRGHTVHNNSSLGPPSSHTHTHTHTQCIF